MVSKSSAPSQHSQNQQANLHLSRLRQPQRDEFTNGENDRPESLAWAADRLVRRWTTNEEIYRAISPGYYSSEVYKPGQACDFRDPCPRMRPVEHHTQPF